MNHLEGILSLPQHWHSCGSVSKRVLTTLIKYTKNLEVEYSMETGSGKTTLLCSHISKKHVVFALDHGGSISCVKESSLLNSANTHFVIGPTQQTLPAFKFKHPLSLAIIDGPHGFPFPILEYYYIYPHLKEKGILIVDDIKIPSIYQFFSFLRNDRMFKLIDVVSANTAFFQRTAEPCLDPLGDGWWQQRYNQGIRLYFNRLYCAIRHGKIVNLSEYIMYLWYILKCWKEPINYPVDSK